MRSTSVRKVFGNRDDALIDFLARDERVAVDPFVGEQSAQKEQAF